MCWPTSRSSWRRTDRREPLDCARWHRHHLTSGSADVANSRCHRRRPHRRGRHAVRDAVDRGLTVHGFTVRSVGDAEQAQRSCRPRRPGVMVVDIGLPGMSGIELCTASRATTIDVPILILSARDEVGDRVAGLQAGADDYLVKPFALDELVARLHALLRRARSTGPLRRCWSPARCGSTSIAGGQRPTTSDWICRGGVRSARRVRRQPRDRPVTHPAARARVGIRLRRRYQCRRRVRWLLRRKLDAAGHAGLIETVRGVGFVLRVP